MGQSQSGWSMNRQRASFTAILAIAVFAAAGCSTKAWYEGMKVNAQNDCRRQPSGVSESCLARINTMSYTDGFVRHLPHGLF